MKRYEWLAQQLQALAHPARLHILEILARGPACVCDLVMLTGKRQPYISQQLIILSEAHLVTAERSGRRIFYHLNMDGMEAVMYMLQTLVRMESTNNTIPVADNQNPFGVERDPS